MSGDISDRATRLLGLIYGSQNQQFQQRASTYDLLVQLRASGVEIDPRHVDHKKILGVDLTSPTVAACLPVSIENPAIAYDVSNDRFKVDVEAMTVGTIDTDVVDRAARLLGVVYGNLDQLQQRATTKELLVQLRSGGAEIDPRDRSWTITENLARSWNLSASDVPDLSDRAARLLGKIYGTQDVLQQRATSKELIVQIQHQGAEKDPTQIRSLTSSDQITVADIAKTCTEKQISNTFAAAGNYTVWDPDADKAVRLKFLSLELSADVDLGYRWGAAGTIHYLRTTAGPYVANLVGCNVQGAADDLFILNASAACTVKGFCLGEEI